MEKQVGDTISFLSLEDMQFMMKDKGWRHDSEMLKYAGKSYFIEEIRHEKMGTYYSLLHCPIDAMSIGEVWFSIGKYGRKKNLFETEE